MSKPSEFWLFFCEKCKWHSEVWTEEPSPHAAPCPLCNADPRNIVVARCHSVFELAEVYEKTGPLVGCMYRHSTGGTCRVLRNAVDGSSLSHVIIYLGENQISWSRSYQQFMVAFKRA